MDQPNVMPRLNARVLQTDPRYLDLTMQSGKLGCYVCYLKNSLKDTRVKR